MSNKFNLIEKSDSLYRRGKDKVLWKELFGCNTILLNKNKKLRANSVLSEANRKKKKHNAAGSSIGEVSSTQELTKPSS